jgi:hypothetical protein
VEISCILTSENQSELTALARYIAGISRRTPLQVMRFLPFETAAIAQGPAIRDAENFCRSIRRLLDYVYLFNTPGSDHLLKNIILWCSWRPRTRHWAGPSRSIGIPWIFKGARPWWMPSVWASDFENRKIEVEIESWIGYLFQKILEKLH